MSVVEYTEEGGPIPLNTESPIPWNYVLIPTFILFGYTTFVMVIERYRRKSSTELIRVNTLGGELQISELQNVMPPIHGGFVNFGLVLYWTACAFALTSIIVSAKSFNTFIVAPGSKWQTQKKMFSLIVSVFPSSISMLSPIDVSMFVRAGFMSYLLSDIVQILLEIAFAFFCFMMFYAGIVWNIIPLFIEFRMSIGDKIYSRVMDFHVRLGLYIVILLVGSVYMGNMYLEKHREFVVYVLGNCLFS